MGFVLFLLLVSVVRSQICFGSSFNSDGAGSHPVSNIPFSTSQNFGVSGSNSRWQTTHWFFNSSSQSGPYLTVKKDTYIDLAANTVFVVQNGNCTAHPMAKNAVIRFSTSPTLLSCVPSGWSNWIGTCGEAHCDTFSIGTVNVRTIVPQEDVNSFLPHRSVLSDASGQILQVRVRENGHYRLLLSIENVGPLVDFPVDVPLACKSASQGKEFEEDTLFPVFWKNHYE